MVPLRHAAELTLPLVHFPLTIEQLGPVGVDRVSHVGDGPVFSKHGDSPNPASWAIRSRKGSCRSRIGQH